VKDLQVSQDYLMTKIQYKSILRLYWAKNNN